MSTESESTITVEPVEGTLPLFHQYPGQYFPQDAAVILNCESGTLYATYFGESGVGNGRECAWTVEPRLDAEQVNELLHDLVPLAERIVAGGEIYWDGNRNRLDLNDDAQAAYDEAEQRVEQFGTTAETRSVITDAGEVAEYHECDSSMSRAQITARAEKLIEEAESDGSVVTVSESQVADQIIDWLGGLDDEQD